MKWMGWVGKLLVSAVLISFLSVFTTVYLVDQYVKAILDRWNLSGIERPTINIGDMFSALTNPTSMVESDESGKAGSSDKGSTELSLDVASGAGQGSDLLLSSDNKDKALNEGDSKSTSGIQEDSNEKESEDSLSNPPAGAVKAGTTPSSADGESEEEALPVFGQATSTESLVMTAEQFNETRKKLSDEDKLEIFTIMMKKLPQSELQKMSELIEDGVTEEEVKQMEDVINAYLHQDDVARLLSILNKY